MYHILTIYIIPLIIFENFQRLYWFFCWNAEDQGKFSVLWWQKMQNFCLHVTIFSYLVWGQNCSHSNQCLYFGSMDGEGWRVRAKNILAFGFWDMLSIPITFLLHLCKINMQCLCRRVWVLEQWNPPLFVILPACCWVLMD